MSFFGKLAMVNGVVGLSAKPLRAPRLCGEWGA